MRPLFGGGTITPCGEFIRLGTLVSQPRMNPTGSNTAVTAGVKQAMPAWTNILSRIGVHISKENHPCSHTPSETERISDLAQILNYRQPKRFDSTHSKYVQNTPVGEIFPTRQSALLRDIMVDG